jgi:hypothetical protein
MRAGAFDPQPARAHVVQGRGFLDAGIAAAHRSHPARSLDGLEVIVEETLESLGSPAFAGAIWSHGGAPMRRFAAIAEDGRAAASTPGLAPAHRGAGLRQDPTPAAARQ